MTLAGYIFVANTDYGWSPDTARVGRAETWDDINSSLVNTGLPVWILVCGSSIGRGFYLKGETIPPAQPKPRSARVQYVGSYDPPVLLPTDPARVDPSLSKATWENNQLPILFGIRPNWRGICVPCGFNGMLFRVDSADAVRLSRLFPRL